MSKVLKLHMSSGPDIVSEPFNLFSDKELLDLKWMVKEVKIFTDETDPNVLYPAGTFEKVAQGRTLMGADSSHPLGSTGGNETHRHNLSDVLVRMTMNSNGKGYFDWKSSDGWAPSYFFNASNGGPYDGDEIIHDGVVMQGEMSEVSSLQPYLAVNYWKRLT